MNPEAKRKQQQAPRAVDSVARAFLYLCLFFYAGILLGVLYYRGWLDVPELIGAMVSILLAEWLLSYLWVKRDKQIRDMLLALNDTNKALNETMKTVEEINTELLAEIKKRRESGTGTP